MITPPGDGLRQFERDGSVTRREPALPAAFPSEPVNEETRVELLGQVQTLRVYLCELLRRNQELRYALSGLGRERMED
jgi:hypothetical protein